MKDWKASTYGDRIAEVYDDYQSSLARAAKVDSVVDKLAELANGGLALELAIGTGRIALPLAARGIEVHGIDASEAMVAKMRAKEGADSIPVNDRRFRRRGRRGRLLAGLRGLQHVLRPGLASGAGAVLPKRGGPPSARRRLRRRGLRAGPVALRPGQNISAGIVDLDQVSLDLNHLDPVAQTIDSHHVLLTEQGVRMYPVRLRYAWPSELDLMAELAGLRLRHRWGDWQGGPFTAASASHVSVYEQV